MLMVVLLPTPAILSQNGAMLDKASQALSQRKNAQKTKFQAAEIILDLWSPQVRALT